MKNQFLNSNLKALRNPIAWLGNIISTIFCVGVMLVLFMQFTNVDVAKTTNYLELFKTLWWVVALGYLLKFLFAYFGQYKRNMLVYWFGVVPEFILYLLTFVVILLTGDLGA